MSENNMPHPAWVERNALMLRLIDAMKPHVRRASRLQVDVDLSAEALSPAERALFEMGAIEIVLRDGCYEIADDITSRISFEESAVVLAQAERLSDAAIRVLAPELRESDPETKAKRVRLLRVFMKIIS